jgi:RecB family endonuclease NucS
MKYVLSPSPKKALKLLQENRGNMATIIGRCRVVYAGRSSSFLDYGDRLVIAKPDGTVMVHGDSKREPLNWQPPGASVQYSIDDGLVVEAVRKRPAEDMYIHFEQVRAISIFHLDDQAEIRKAGAEMHMVDLIEKDPSVIEPGLRVIRREMATKSGYIDLFCEDSEGRPVVVEVKRARISPRAVHQLEAYLIDMRKKNKDAPIRGILCAPRISEMARTLIEEKGLEFRQICCHFELPARVKGRKAKSSC